MNEDIKSYVSNNNMIVLYFGNVSEIRKKAFNRNKQPFLITDQVVTFCNTKTIEPSYWINIKSLKYDEKSVEITFNDKKEVLFSASKNELPVIFGIIIDILQRVLTAQQKEKLDLSKFRLMSKSNQLIGYSLLSRFISYSDINSTNWKEYFRVIETMLMTQLPTLSCSHFNPETHEDVLPIFIDLLPFIHSAEHFEFTGSSKPFKYFVDHISSIENLANLSINSEDKETFTILLDKIRQSDFSLEGMNLSSFNFEENDVQTVVKFINDMKMTSLGLNSHSISKTYLNSNKFYEDFNCSNTLLYLNFSNLAHLNLNLLIPKIKKLSILSFSNCNIDVNKLFQLLNDTDFPNLTQLDISGNDMKKPLTATNKLPRNLYKIVCNKVNWGNSDNIISFLKYIFRRMNEYLWFSIGLIKFESNSHWSPLFQFLSSCDPNQFYLQSITAFSWDGNPVNSEFFDFLNKLTMLETLSLSKSLKKEITSGNKTTETISQESVQLLCEYLKNSTKLKRLIIKGSGKIKLKSLFTDYLAASIETVKTLKELDITNNNIGGNGITAINSLIQKNPSQFGILAFDGSNPDSIQPILTIYNTCSQDQIKTKISFPVNDMYLLIDSGKATQQDFEILRSLSQRMIPNLESNYQLKQPTSHSQLLIPASEDSPLDKPFFVYCPFHLSDEFTLPKYIKRGTYKKVELKERNDTKPRNMSNIRKSKSQFVIDAKTMIKKKNLNSESPPDDKPGQKTKKQKSDENSINKAKKPKVRSNDSSSSDSSDFELKSSIEHSDEQIENLKKKRVPKTPDAKSRNSNIRIVMDDELFGMKSHQSIRSISHEHSDSTDGKKNRVSLSSESDSENSQKIQSNLKRRKTTTNFENILKNQKRKFNNSPLEKTTTDLLKKDENQNQENVIPIAWEFPYQMVPNPTDNKSLIQSIDQKYSILELIKDIK